MSVFGIDLGNESMVMASAGGGGINVVVNETSNRQTPTMVSFPETGMRAIGEAALTVAVSNFKGTVFDVKRFLGVGTKPAALDVDMLPSKSILQANADGDESNGFVLRVGGELRFFRPEQVLAMLLKKLHSHAPKGASNEVVIAVPAFFSHAQRIAVHHAARIAGLNCLRVMHDTTAAALEYGLFRGPELPPADKPAERIVIVDIGQSALKVAAISLHQGALEVAGHACDEHFGTRQIDYALTMHFASEFEKKTRVPIREYPKSMLRLQAAVEKLKKNLSANPQGHLNVESLCEDRDLSAPLNREQMEAIIAPLLPRLAETCAACLHVAKWSTADVSAVEVIGGGSRIPVLKKILADFFKQEPKTRLNASESVARGASLMTAMLSPKFRVKEFGVKDVSYHPVAVSWVTAKGEAKVSELFPRGSHFPSSRMISFIRSDLPVDREEFNIVIHGVGVATVSRLPKNGPADAVVKVKISMNIDGLVSIDSAQYIVETVEEIASPVGAEQPQEQQQQQQQQEGAPPQQPATRVVKNKTDLAVVMHYDESLKVMTEKDIEAAFELEGKLSAEDKLIAETQDRKNALEAYIYDMRSKVADDSDAGVGAFMDDGTKERFLRAMDDMESWLYNSEEAETANKSTFVKKLEELQSFGNPAVARYNEYMQRPSAVASFERAVASLREKLHAAVSADQNDNTMAVAVEDASKLEVLINDASHWLQNALSSITATKKTMAPPVSVTQMNERAAKLMSDALALLNKPKPKPKEPTPAEGAAGSKQQQPESEAKMEDCAAAAEEGAASGSHMEDVDDVAAQ